jgi:hypothetical protein
MPRQAASQNPPFLSTPSLRPSTPHASQSSRFRRSARVNSSSVAGAKNPNNLKPIAGSAAIALNRWFQALSAQRIDEGQIFRAIRHDRIGEPLRPNGIRQIIKARPLLSGRPLRHISPHSL